ncbi:hypothetical protein EDC01DRAFT_636087 [Geopyxis carbonaria]|nr:hypothetical protein EDC01DRAFT_636087 [Geopyxis carbonaria]
MNILNQRPHPRAHQPMATPSERALVGRGNPHDAAGTPSKQCACAGKLAPCPPCGEAQALAIAAANEKRRQDRRPDPVVYDTAEAQARRLEADRRVRLVEQKLYQRYGREARRLTGLVVARFLAELAVSGL